MLFLTYFHKLSHIAYETNNLNENSLTLFSIDMPTFSSSVKQIHSDENNLQLRKQLIVFIWKQ